MSIVNSHQSSNYGVSKSKKVAIVQPYVPSYRREFFSAVQAKLNSHGIDISVWQTGLNAEQAARGDAIRAPWIKSTGRVFRFGLLRAKVSLTLTPKLIKSVDCIVLPLEGTSLDIPLALLMKRFFDGPCVILWGHVKNYVSSGNWIDSKLERLYMRKADRVYAYTHSGESWAIQEGVCRNKVTSLSNTIDTSAITRAMSELRGSRLVEQYGLDPTSTFSYIGGLDRSKRIDFLARAFDLLWEDNPKIRVLVAGEGADADLLDGAIERGQVIRLGRVGAEGKAEMARASTAMIMPGRVGLVAVDALAMGLPVLTTDWKFHAPEYDYLEPGASVFVSDNTEGAFAHLISTYSRKRPHAKVPEPPALENMINVFCHGIVHVLRNK